MQPCRYDASAARPLVGGSLGANPRLLEVGAVLLILWAIAIRDLWEEAHMIDTLVRLVPVGTLALTAVSVISSPPPTRGRAASGLIRMIGSWPSRVARVWHER